MLESVIDTRKQIKRIKKLRGKSLETLAVSIRCTEYR